MAKDSEISWTQATYNPWSGCIKVSQGCKFCYMYRDKNRYGQDPEHVIRSRTTFNDPLKWKEPRLIFTCSWSDFFIQQADVLRPEAWDIIKRTPHHTYQILTKRPERILSHLPPDWRAGYPNVWLGVSVENNDNRERIRILSEVPAVTRFVSIEPLIGPVDLSEYVFPSPFATKRLIDLLDWVIIGGESGNETGDSRYRPMELSWMEDIVTQCVAYNKPVFVKQLGTHQGKLLNLKNRHGADINEMPPHLRCREFPHHYKPSTHV